MVPLWRGSGDGRHAGAIAERARARARPKLRPVNPPGPLDGGIRPPLERRIAPKTRAGLVLLSRDAAPETIRAAGAKRILRRLTKAATGLRGLDALTAAAGPAPAQRRSGKTSFPRRAAGGDKALKRVFR